MTPRFWIYLAVIAGALFVGVMWQKDRQDATRLQAQLIVWKDSVKAEKVRADEAEHLFDSTKAAYYALKPAVIQVVHWKAKVDTLTQSITVAGDTAAAQQVQALFDSLTSEYAQRDSVARSALEAASAALRAKDSLLAVVTHPPKSPSPPVVGFYASGAYDMIAHGAALQVGVELKKWPVKPFVAAGALIAGQATGSLQVGVRIEF